ncbi:MAG: YIP1 family protein [Acidobacteriota bacterium]
MNVAEPSSGGDAIGSRLITVLTSPTETFRKVAAKPRWWVPLLFLMIAAVVLQVAVHHQTDYRQVMEDQMAKQSSASMTEQQIETAAEIQEKFGAAFAFIGAIFAAIVMLIIGLLYWVILKLAGSEMTYPQSLATHLYGAVPAVLGMLIAAPIVWFGGELTTEQITTRSFMSSSLAFLAPEGASSKLVALLASVEFFTIWSVILTAIGFQVVAKVSKGAAWGAVLLLTALGIAVRVLFA